MLSENAGDLTTASLSFSGFCLGSVPWGPAVLTLLLLPAGLDMDRVTASGRVSWLKI